MNTSVAAQRPLILLVEDETDIRELVRRLIERIGYNVVEAENGQVALSIFLARQNEIACLVSDITMPQMDGLKLAQQIATAVPLLPIILMSGKPLAVLPSNVEFIAKPFSLRELQAVLNRLVPLP